MRAFSRFKNENSFKDLAYNDKLAKDKKGMKHLLVRQDLFDRTVDAKGIKTKNSKETVRSFLSMNAKKNRPKKWVDKGTEFKKLCKTQEKQIYSTMSETNAAFAERTKRSLKKYFTVTWNTMDASTYTN